VSAEHYARVGPPALDQPFEGSSTVSRAPIARAAQAVTNVAVGVRHRFSPTLAGYLSGAADRSAADTSYNLSL
jgi:hypothetical protein